MPTVVFESRGAPSLEVDAPEGGRLVDLCDERTAPVPFSCRSASCGTCRILVLDGVDLLDPPKADEIEVLEAFGDDGARGRLACQARVRAGPGLLRIRAAE